MTVPCGPHEWLCDGGLRDRGQVVTAALVMADQGAQAGCRDVSGEGGAVLLLIARVTKGGREREPAGKRH